MSFTKITTTAPAVAAAPPKTPTESYLGFLYALEDVAVYGYVTPLKLKIVLALALTDAVVHDANIISVRSSTSSSPISF